MTIRARVAALLRRWFRPRFRAVSAQRSDRRVDPYRAPSITTPFDP